jgi:hypothetical protein
MSLSRRRLFKLTAAGVLGGCIAEPQAKAEPQEALRWRHAYGQDTRQPDEVLREVNRMASHLYEKLAQQSREEHL